MNAPTRVAAFLLGVAAVFGLALVVGVGVGPLGAQAESGGSTHEHAGTGHDADHTEESSTTAPTGLSVSSGGYTLSLRDTTAQPGADRPVSFQIEGPDGPVTTYDVQHEKLLHLVAVRRDFTGFQHVHPTLAPDGTWTTALDLTPGEWRVFADLKPAGAEPVVLGSDLSVPGRMSVASYPRSARVSTVDGYTVTLAGDLGAGHSSRLTLSVARDGRAVTDLGPYLGAYGHLVALRSGDLAYLHVHPVGVPGDGTTDAGPAVEFDAQVPSAGAYHLYLDFKHDGVVRTASFVLNAEESP